MRKEVSIDLSTVFLNCHTLIFRELDGDGVITAVVLLCLQMSDSKPYAA